MGSSPDCAPHPCGSAAAPRVRVRVRVRPRISIRGRVRVWIGVRVRLKGDEAAAAHRAARRCELGEARLLIVGEASW